MIRVCVLKPFKGQPRREVTIPHSKYIDFYISTCVTNKCFHSANFNAALTTRYSKLLNLNSHGIVGIKPYHATHTYLTKVEFMIHFVGITIFNTVS